MAVFSGLSLLPDVDYLGVMLGMPDSGPCGHRGATHSLILPLLTALVAAVVAGRLNLPRARTALLCGLVVASHSLLDAMTVTSRGVPLLWPFTFARFEMSWRPIPNAPCGLDYLSREGLRVAAIECVQFMPLLLLALRPINVSATLRGEAIIRRDDSETRPARPRRLTHHAAGTSRF